MNLADAKKEIRRQMGEMLENTKHQLSAVRGEVISSKEALTAVGELSKSFDVDKALARVMTLCECFESLRSYAFEARAMALTLSMLETVDS